MKEILQGQWRMVGDSTVNYLFSKDSLKEFSIDLHEVDYSTYKISENPCDTLGFFAKGTGFYLERYDAEDTLCYSIFKINENNLELIYLTGGRVLVFRKIPDQKQ